MSSVSLSSLRKAVEQALHLGGDVLRKGAKIKHRVEFKTSTSPVTQVDRAAERKIISFIRRRFPEHTFLAEESAFLKKGDLGRSRPGRFRWIIDPLDGTINFMHGVGQSCVSIGVETDGQVLVGGVYDPFRNELFMAQKGKGAVLNGKKIQVSAISNLVHAMVVTGFPYDRSKFTKPLLSMLTPFIERGIDLRRFGSAAIDLAWVACGRVDIYWEFKLCPWDMAAGWLLVEEAGGKISNFRGQKIDIDNPLQIMATNGRLHSKVLNLFRANLKSIDAIR